MLDEAKIMVRGVNVSIERVNDALRSCFRSLLRSQRKGAWTPEAFAEELRIAVRRELEADVGYKCIVSLFVHRI
jgi:hypothetical protein